MKRHATGILCGLFVLTLSIAGCSSREKAPPVADSADQAVLQITEGLADGRPQVVWHALPESYQRDVTELVHEFGSNMDAEVWDRGFGVVQKLTRVLDEKRDFILDHPMLATQIEDRDKVVDAWDDVVGVLQVLAESELADLDRVKNLDVERFLSGTGADLFESFRQIEAFAPAQATRGSLFGLADAKVELLSSEGDRARVRIEVPGQPAKEDDYVRVEGKWIPESMASGWDRTISSAREQLAALSGEAMQENKQTTLMQLAMVESALDQLLATENAEQFHLAVNGLMGMAMGAVMAQARSVQSQSFEASPISEPVPLPSPTPDLPTIIETAAQEPASAETQAYRRESIEQYLGDEVRVHERGGGRSSGVLVSVSDDLVILEKHFPGGSITVELNPARIESFEPI